MIRHYGKSSFVGAVINARRLTLTALVVVISGAIASPQASAGTLAIRQGPMTVMPGDGHRKFDCHVCIMHGGNGEHSKNTMELFGYNINKGPQVVDNTVTGGKTYIQVARCKWHRCKISQKIRARR
jgi:hypothetical protein